MLRRAALVGCGGVVLGAVVLASKPEWRVKVVSTADGTLRFLRTAWQAAAVAADYKYSFRNVEKGDDGYWELRERVDARAAKRLLKVCKANGGVYTKMGQYLASMNHVLPPVFTETLSVLQDKASHRSIQEVSDVLDRELGMGALKKLFAEFEPSPVASASLAQVHRAVTHDGREVAVKVQYPGLEAQVRADQFTTRFLVGCLGRAFPDFEFSWMLPEFEDNLRLELDFTQEARNSERVAGMFRGQRDVHVPPVFHELTTRRVLTMEFVRGVKPTNAEALATLGVSGTEVAAKASRVFGDMIHVHGFVHCDPHPGNLLVRKDVEGQTQLVVLDHGMYRRLDQSFRAAYCRLWKGMILTDAELVQSAAREMGLGEFAEVLPLLFIYRPVAGTRSTDVGKRMSPEQRQRLKQQFKGTTMKDVNLFLQRLPRDMLFVMRSTNLVRSLNKELGGTTRQRVRIMAESAIRGLALDHAYNRHHSSQAPGVVLSAGASDGSVGGAADALQNRLDTASVFAPHTINAPVDSEVAAEEGGGLSTRAWLQLWWDVGRLRFRTMALDAWVGLMLWWRGIDLDMDTESDSDGPSSSEGQSPAEQRQQWSKRRKVAQMG